MNELTLDEFKARLISFVDDLYSIPDDFIIHDEYLEQLSKQDFIKAFKEYRDIMKRMYQEAALKPYEFGFSCVNKNNGEERLENEYKSTFTFRDKLALPQHFINRLCNSSKLENNSLVIDVDILNESIKQVPKIKRVDYLINKFAQYGFIFTGYNSKLSKTNELIVTYPKNPQLIKVIKSYSESKYSKVGMEYDYAHFNYLLLSNRKNENLKLSNLFIFQTLSQQSQIFLLEFNQAMNQKGFSYGDCPTSGYCWGRSQFAYSKKPEKKTNYVCRLYQRGIDLVVRLYLSSIDEYADYIEKAPSYIKEVFTNDFGKCKHCKEQCKSRKTYTINQKVYQKCDGLTFEFYNVEPSAIPYYLQLIYFSENSKKSHKSIKHEYKLS